MEATQSSRAREYETVYLLKPTSDKASSEKIAERVGDVVNREGGKLTLVENWGRRKLAFPVGKNTRGIYVYVKYLGGGALVRELERNLRMLDDVLKFQTVKVADDIDQSSVSVDPEAIKYEALEPLAEGDEEDESLERKLGLDGSRVDRRSHSDSEDVYDDSDDGDDDGPSDHQSRNSSQEEEPS